MCPRLSLKTGRARITAMANSDVSWLLETKYYIQRLLGNVYFSQMRTADMLVPLDRLTDEVRVRKVIGFRRRRRNPDPLCGVGASKHYSTALGYAALRAAGADDEYWLPEVVRLLGLLMFATLAAESYTDTLLVVERLRRMPEATQPLLPLMMMTVEGVARERITQDGGLTWVMGTEERCNAAYAELVRQAGLLWQGTRGKEAQDGVMRRRCCAFGEESQSKILEALQLCVAFANGGSRVWQQRALRLIKEGWLLCWLAAIPRRSWCGCVFSSVG